MVDFINKVDVRGITLFLGNYMVKSEHLWVISRILRVSEHHSLWMHKVGDVLQAEDGMPYAIAQPYESEEDGNREHDVLTDAGVISDMYAVWVFPDFIDENILRIVNRW